MITSRGARLFDTVLCVNVLECVEDPVQVSGIGWAIALTPGGTWSCWCRRGRKLFGTLDQDMGQLRRFSEPDLRRLLEQRGIPVRANSSDQ